jgi:hypothetical protein
MPHPNEHAVASRAGTLGPVSTHAQSLTGVFRLLAEQHRQAASLLQRAERCADAAERQTLWIEIRRQLLSHERGEALELYPALEGYDAARDIVAQHTRQAEELESVINDVGEVDYTSEEWTARVQDVVALFEEHVEEEERDFFPRAQEILGERTSTELEERFIGAQAQVLNTLV